MFLKIPKNILLLQLVILFTLNTNAQLLLNLQKNGEPNEQPDTLYFPYNKDQQLIIINAFDTWERKIAFKERSAPRAMSWASILGPAPKNIYIVRNKKGVILKAYNAELQNFSSLKNSNFNNSSSKDFYKIADYINLGKRFLVYDTNGKAGLIDTLGNLVLPMEYGFIRNYGGGFIKEPKLIIEADGKFGMLDTNLKILFPPIYYTNISTDTYDGDSTTQFYVSYPEHNILHNGNIKVFKDGKCGLINDNGKVLIDFIFDNIISLHEDMYAGLNYKTLTSNVPNILPVVSHCTVLSKTFKTITTLKNYDSIQYYGIKQFIVKKDNKIGLVNFKGEIIIPIIYDSLSPQESGFYAVINNKAGFINSHGKVLIPIEFDGGLFFYDKAIYVTQNGLIGIYNKQYKLIVAPQFNTRIWNMGKFILLKQDGTKGFVDHSTSAKQYYQSPTGVKVAL